MKNRKMISPFMPLLAITLLISLNACDLSGETIRGDGNVVTETFRVDHFHSIDLSGMFNVTLEPGTDLVITLETDANLQELITINTRNGVLVVSTQRDAVLRPTTMDLHIIYPELQKIAVGGACRISSQQVLTTSRMEFDLSGASSIDLELDVEELLTLVSGAGSINLQGYATSHKLELSGASSLNARDLITQHTQIDLSGAGSAHVHATQSLKAGISGVGSIRYYGDPQQTDLEKSGLGSIRSAQ